MAIIGKSSTMIQARHDAGVEVHEARIWNCRLSILKSHGRIETKERRSLKCSTPEQSRHYPLLSISLLIRVTAVARFSVHQGQKTQYADGKCSRTRHNNRSRKIFSISQRMALYLLLANFRIPSAVERRSQ